MTQDKKMVDSILVNDTILATGPYSINLYNKGYFGLPEKDGVRLNGFEALHLLELRRINIIYNQQSLTFKDVQKYFSKLIPQFMLRYLVYKDLRNRGYVINVGKGSEFFFRLYPREAKPKIGGAKYYIIPLQEGSSIELSKLEYLINLANNSQKQLIFGMVDVIGDVSYLRSEEINPTL